MIKKILTHWTFCFVTVFVLAFIGLKDPLVKEILRNKKQGIIKEKRI